MVARAHARSSPISAPTSVPAPPVPGALGPTPNSGTHTTVSQRAEELQTARPDRVCTATSSRRGALGHAYVVTSSQRAWLVTPRLRRLAGPACSRVSPLCGACLFLPCAVAVLSQTWCVVRTRSRGRRRGRSLGRASRVSVRRSRSEPLRAAWSCSSRGYPSAWGDPRVLCTLTPRGHPGPLQGTAAGDEGPVLQLRDSLQRVD